MNTHTHILLAAALFARPGRENRINNTAVLAGAFMPDALIFVMFGWSKLIGAPESEVWTTWYFNPPWLTAIDWMNSIPLFAGMLLVGWVLPKRHRLIAGISSAITLFALAATTHILGDLPFHVHDGHAHFVPFSQWRFVSPVSYWDPKYYGNIVSVIELIGGMALIVILWRRFTGSIVHAALAIATLGYAVPYVWFVLLGGHSEHNASVLRTLSRALS